MKSTLGEHSMSEIEELRIAVEANEKDIDDLEKTIQALSDIC